MSTPSVTPYVPFDASKYVRQSDLSKIELSILSNRSHRSDWGYLQSEIPELMRPLADIAAHSGVSQRLAISSVAVILWNVSKTGKPYWCWSESQWLTLLSNRAGSRPYLASVAYHLGDFRTPQRIAKFRQPAIYASFIFGHAVLSYCQIWCMTIRQRSCPIDYPPVFHLETEHCPRPASVDRIPLFASSVSERIGAV